jgi:predicted short-subunit dehydrogenase-like oxidoreductase (DUF2520 family)
VRAKRGGPVVLIGSGRVATALAFRLCASGRRVAAVVSRKRSSARRLARRTSIPLAADSLNAIPLSGSLIIIAVPDDAIAGVAARMALLRGVDWRSVQVLHTSGAATSDELGPLHALGAATGSLHPLQTFPPGLTKRELLRLTRSLTFGFEGDARAEQTARRLVRSMGGRLTVIPKELKIPYHVACAVSSNYAVVLVGVVEQLLRTFRVPIRPRDVRRLMETSIARAFAVGAEQALTGPIVRGDAATVRRHLAVLDRNGGPVELYRILGREALKLALRSRRLRPAAGARVRRQLREDI